jgi:hypothetical protein
MKRLFFVAAFVLCGCDGTVFISENGTEEIGYCDIDIAVCSMNNCPHGAFTLRNADKHAGSKIVRCLPAPKENPQ